MRDAITIVVHKRRGQSLLLDCVGWYERALSAVRHGRIRRGQIHGYDVCANSRDATNG